MSNVKDTTEPKGAWAFGQDVTACFDDMLQRSIPQYDVMRKAVTDLAGDNVQPGATILDLGCSRGEALRPLIARFGAKNYFVGIDVSRPMLEAARQQFKGYIDAGVVQINECDLRSEFPMNCPTPYGVILSILTLQFIPIEYRQRIISNVYKMLGLGGAFIVVEKVLGADADLDERFIRHYYQFKTEHGYSDDQIERKRLSLEGILVPVTAAWNEELLKHAGFREVDCFWRWMNFAGWIAVK